MEIDRNATKLNEGSFATAVPWADVNTMGEGCSELGAGVGGEDNTAPKVSDVDCMRESGPNFPPLRLRINTRKQTQHDRVVKTSQQRDSQSGGVSCGAIRD
jgi:hypothetical protein